MARLEEYANRFQFVKFERDDGILQMTLGKVSFCEELYTGPIAAKEWSTAHNLKIFLGVGYTFGQAGRNSSEGVLNIRFGAEETGKTNHSYTDTIIILFFLKSAYYYAKIISLLKYTMS